MEIILKQDVSGLGYKNDLLTVKDGFGRNYLIPKDLAILATPSERKQLDELKKQQAFKEEKIVKEVEAIKTVLEGAEISIPQKVGESGKLFGSVTPLQASLAIKEQKQIEIDRKNITISETIKTIGTYPATIKLHKDLAFDVQLVITGE